ncbi:unnamed protein product [Ambrosiozyma monospora]|uniref:Unnamed protein product n=1 Tax=Ambrosiozyma monospora TaxID=43982 RepID=A0ACB5U7Y8_AMBMO|nr:unnamed protein product [Ambrosiozyma monospora]
MISLSVSAFGIPVDIVVDVDTEEAEDPLADVVLVDDVEGVLADVVFVAVVDDEEFKPAKFDKNNGGTGNLTFDELEPPFIETGGFEEFSCKEVDPKGCNSFKASPVDVEPACKFSKDEVSNIGLSKTPPLPALAPVIEFTEKGSCNFNNLISDSAHFVRV